MSTAVKSKSKHTEPLAIVESQEYNSVSAITEEAAIAPSDKPNDSPYTSKPGRKPKRIDSNGKPMRRLVLVFASDDYDRVMTAISIRFSPLFARVYGGEKISMAGPQEEYYARAFAAICDAWQASIEDKP